MLEKTIVNGILKYLKSLDGCFCFKHNGLVAGIPDILCCYKGQFIAFEVKTKKGRVSKLQKVVIEKINKAGGVACVVRSVNEVKDVIGGMT